MNVFSPALHFSFTDPPVACSQPFSQEHAMRHLLVPLDGSGFGESALWLAAAIAARTGRDLELVTVNTPATHPDITAALAAEIEATCGTHARAYLESQAEEVHRRFGIVVHTAVLDGDVPNAMSTQVRVSPPE